MIPLSEFYEKIHTRLIEWELETQKNPRGFFSQKKE